MRIFIKKHKLIGVIILSAFLLTGCGLDEKKEKNHKIIPVKVEKTTAQNLSEMLEYSGDIKAQDEAIVYPKVSGKIIEKIKEDGAFVKKGEVIAYIDRDEVGLKFEKAPVESFVSGVIGRIYVDIGTNVTPQTPIALVVNMDTVKINLDIPEKYLSKIILGQNAKISVDTYPGEEFLGQINKISPVLDLSTRTAPIEITAVNENHSLKSGMFAKVKLILQEHNNALVIRKESIIGRIPDTYVYALEGNKAFLKKVTLGIKQGPYFEVVEGLKEGDLVVTMGQQRLRDGSIVSIEE